MTHSEFQQWQHHFITQEYFLHCKERIEDIKNLLAGSAGINPGEDNFRRGYIMALHDVLDFYHTNPIEEFNEASTS